MVGRLHYYSKENLLCYLENTRIIVAHYLGHHCCLFCHITQDNMAIPCESQGLQRPRTLETLQSDLQNFKAAGANMKVAKEYNNVISSVQFSVPLDQVLNIRNCPIYY